MAVSGIIAEFNPLHKGHEYLISKAKEKGAVICVISGNFVQRGEVAIAEKGVRAKAALLAGCDLVLELPVLWSMSTAQNFALGGVSALAFSGCDRILFGSEEGKISALSFAAEVLCSAAFSEKVGEYLKTGVTFAAAREAAAKELGVGDGLLSRPNNNLGIEYMIAAKNLGSDISFETVRRLGADHDSQDLDQFVSATLLRQKFRNGEADFCREYMSESVFSLFNTAELSDPALMERAVLALLRTRTREELSALPDLSEGVENKLYSAISSASDLDGLLAELKVKRYPLARLRRLVLSAFLGLDSSLFMKPLPYIRVLGFSPEGEKLLKTHLSRSPIPVITRTADLKRLDSVALKVFETEERATDLFALSLGIPFERGLEKRRKLIKTE